jgi:hypothetical protein
MFTESPTRHRSRAVPALARCLPSCEELEPRQLLSAGPFPAEDPVDDTLVQARDLGSQQPGEVQVTGIIGDSPAGAADVDFFQFSPDETAWVHLSVAGTGADTFQGVLSLYAPDPLSWSGYQLLAQGNGSLDLGLRGGETYLVAVSGTGNQFFHPFLADSGYDGATGAYTLTVSTTFVGLTAGDGPIVLFADPDVGSNQTLSPLALRVRLNEDLDQTTITFSSSPTTDDTVRLIFNATGTFGTGDEDVALAGADFIPDTGELLITPESPLRPGFYQLILAGDPGLHTTVLTGIDGDPLGKDAVHDGQDVVVSFQVSGSEGNTTAGAGADDTVDTAHDLGDVSDTGLVQVSGAIGDDPTDPIAFNPSDVDLYRFEITSDGHYAFRAEVFAGRIGSALTPALTLFRQDDSDPGSLIFVTSNNGTANETLDLTGNQVLLTDPALLVPLDRGVYFLAVSSSFNYPDAFVAPGTFGVFDPLVSHSGSAGSSTGDYVLNLLVEPTTESPQVVSVSIAEGDTTDGPPATFTVVFDHPVNVQQLSFEAFRTFFDSSLASVVIIGSDSQTYFPRLQSYDPETNQATFILLEPLPLGSAELHLSGYPSGGAPGLADLGGNPLVGNQADPEGDTIVHFTVGGAAHDTLGGQLHFDAQKDDSLASPQDLGNLFPRELEVGVVIDRSAAIVPADSPDDTDDFFQFTVFQEQDYIFNLTGFAGSVEVTDPDGNPVDSLSFGSIALARLTPGTYVVQVGGWAPVDADTVSYSLTVSMSGAADQPTPLVSGPAPALRVRLVGPLPDVPLPAPTPPAQVVLGDQPGLVLTTPAVLLTTVGTGTFSTSNPFLGPLPSQVLLSLVTQSSGSARGIGQEGTASPTTLVSLSPANPALLAAATRLSLIVGLMTAPAGEETLTRTPQPGSVPTARMQGGLSGPLWQPFATLASSLRTMADGTVSLLDGFFAVWGSSGQLPANPSNTETEEPPPVAPLAEPPEESSQAGQQDVPWAAWSALALGSVVGLASGRSSRERRRHPVLRP